MYLRDTNLKAAADFLNSPLWADFKRCLQERRTESASVTDDIHVAAAKGFKRAGFEEAIAEIEKLPFERPEKAADPFDRPALNPDD